MTPLEQRIRAALGDSTAKSPWEQLIALFQADREAFYQLACDGVSPQAEQRSGNLAGLALEVRVAVNGGYEIEPSGDGANLVSAAGTMAFIPGDVVPRVAQFLREIDGKTTLTAGGKDYEGEVASEAEVRFKLGDRTTWDRERAKLEEERSARPLLLRLSPEEIGSLATQPPYVTWELLECARRTVLAPTWVFKGLKRGEGSLSKVNNGWAFCGMPRKAYRNDGTPFPAPEGMVHMVYADEEGYVFDWDWVRENPDEPGSPLDWQLRFDSPNQLGRDAILDLPKTLQPGQFDATKACYSSRGDCIFCYMTDEESFAERINPDLTVFKKLGSDRVTGFKIKNVQRILQKDKSVLISDAPGLTVEVVSVLLATLKLHPEVSVQIYTVLIQALYKRLDEPPKVHVPPQLARLLEPEPSAA